MASPDRIRTNGFVSFICPNAMSTARKTAAQRSMKSPRIASSSTSSGVSGSSSGSSSSRSRFSGSSKSSEKTDFAIGTGESEEFAVSGVLPVLEESSDFFSSSLVCSSPVTRKISQVNRNGTCLSRRAMSPRQVGTSNLPLSFGKLTALKP